MTTISSLAFSKIEPNSIVSLGGGSNVFNLVKEIATHPEYNLNLYSPSELTIIKCKELGLQVKPIQEVDEIDIAFDGCDSVNYQLNALKSKGGIHYFEKLAAQKSGQYILLLPKKRIVPTLSNKIQLCSEVAFDSRIQILNLCKKMNLKAEIRLDQAISDYAYTKNGNLLIDVYSQDWKNISDIDQILCSQNGILSTSYFKNLVTSLITMQDDNAIEIKKGDLK